MSELSTLFKRLEEEFKRLSNNPLLSAQFKPLPEDIYNAFIKKIQESLEKFKHSSTDDQKIEAISDIRSALDEIEMYQKPSILAEAHFFKLVNNNLFRFMREELTKLGLTLDASTQASSDASTESSSQLSSLLRNILPNTANKLMEILAKGKKASFNQEMLDLFSDETSENRERWEKFLLSHDVTFLGGINSQNFKVLNLHTDEIEILRCDNKPNPRYLDRYLREKIKDFFTPIYAFRHAVGEINHQNASRALIVTQYCHQGAVSNYARSQHIIRRSEVFASAVNIGTQMCTAYLNIQQAGFFFRDSKLTNWLVNDNNKVCVSDTKSFVFIDEQGRYSKDLELNKNFSNVDTPGFRLPEFEAKNMKKPFDAEKAHAALLGKNLFAYLTAGGNGWPPYNTHNIMPAAFTDIIFLSQSGRQFKALIIQLTDLDPNKRPSLLAAQAALEKIGAGINIQLEIAIANLRKVGIPLYISEDSEMERYINHQMDAYCSNTSTPEEKYQIIRDIQNLSETLHQGFNKEILAIIAEFQSTTWALSTNKGIKAHMIANAFRDIPLDQRVNPLGMSSSLYIPLVNALNYDRCSFGLFSRKETTSFKKIRPYLQLDNVSVFEGATSSQETEEKARFGGVNK